MAKLTKKTMREVASISPDSDVVMSCQRGLLGTVAIVSDQTKTEYTNNTDVGEGNCDTKLCKQKNRGVLCIMRRQDVPQSGN